MSSKRYNYPYSAMFVEAKDGNTIVLEVDVGFEFHVRMEFKLDNCNCWSMFAPIGPKRDKALEARKYVSRELDRASDILIAPPRREYGVYIASILYRKDGGKKWHNIGERLIQKGLGSPPNQGLVVGVVEGNAS